MAFDVSRFTFDAWKDYFGVVMEQGRVQTDADWNEWIAEFRRRIDAGTLDILGRAVVPATTPDAFGITVPTGGNDLTIGCGRMYVDGLLVENHGPWVNGAYDMANAVWDPALEEMSGAPQPPPPAGQGQSVDFTQQRYFPGASLASLTPGQYLAYLDVWRRPVVYLQDDSLVDKAIGLDTSGRLQTAWQVRLMPVPQGQTWSCSTPDAQIFPGPSVGRLSANVEPNATAGPCCLTTGAGYTGVENQLYRVEIHSGGSPGDPANPKGATFKWSRENASVATLVTNIAPATNSLNQPAFQLTVASLGRDNVLGFTPGNWIELIDETLDLTVGAGEMYLIDSVDFSAKTITLTTQLQASSHFTYAALAAAALTRIRRWDQSGVVYESDGKTVWYDLGQAGSGGVIPVTASDTTLILENGVIVTFSLASASGAFNVGDFWTFAARTADGTVDTLVNAPTEGVHHHYTKLSFVAWPNGPASSCRLPWPPAGQGGGCCCGVSVGPNAQFTTIQQAINSLTWTGGEISVMPGKYFEYVSLNGRSDIVIKGCGPQTRLISPALQRGGAGAATPVATLSGLAAVVEILRSQHVQLLDLCIEAADGECGILLDRARMEDDILIKGMPTNCRDVRLAGLAISASTRPGIYVNEAELVEIDCSRIAMKAVFSQFPGVYLSGVELRFQHNWVGLRPEAAEWLPAEMNADLASQAVANTGASTSGSASAGGTAAPAANSTDALAVKGLGAPGGVQIGGASKDVFIIENEIEGGDRNGVGLGSVRFLDANGADTGAATGVVWSEQDNCATNVGNQIPPTVGKFRVVAGARLINITIARNRIRRMGLSGIGPVGVFDLVEAIETISIENLTISGNAIEGCLNWPLADNGFGYGAISTPDVKALRVFDNSIVDFGATPGAARAWAVYVLFGELVEISRNRIAETRDFALAERDEKGAPSTGRGGIAIAGVAPLSFTSNAAQASWAAVDTTYVPAAISPAFEPGLPALRIESNLVRVACGLALIAIGLGPYSILGNHLATGGSAPVSDVAIGTTVLLLNLGRPIEFDQPYSRFSEFYEARSSASNSLAAASLGASTNGTLLFSNNVCQLEARASKVHGYTSVLAATLDHVLFANNVCWVDGPRDTRLLWVDGFVLGMTVQVVSNRFQESASTVAGSALTYGAMNITSLNMSTYKILPIAGVTSKLGPVDNVSWV
jgi:hypothetical protein